MTLIRKIAFTIAFSGLVVVAPMASANTTSGSLQVFTVSSQNSVSSVGTTSTSTSWSTWFAGLLSPGSLNSGSR